MNVDIRELQAVAGPYPMAAFEFVRMGLAHTSRSIHGEPPSRPEADANVQLPGASQTKNTSGNTPPKKPGKPTKVVHPSHLITGAFLPDDDANDPIDESRHVSGAQLCDGLRDFAIRQYGLLAGTVLRSWGLTSTSDFGNIVFAMIEVGLFRKTQEDTREEFDGLFTIDDAFPDVLGKK